MYTSERVTTTAGNLVREFSHCSDVALGQPVVITRDGQPRNVLISVEEYERLRRRDRQVFMAADTPDDFLADIEALAGAEAG